MQTVSSTGVRPNRALVYVSVCFHALFAGRGKQTVPERTQTTHGHTPNELPWVILILVRCSRLRRAARMRPL